MYFFLPFLNGVKACCIKCLSATSFELKYVGDKSGPFIYFTADIRYFSLQHGSRIQWEGHFDAGSEGEGSCPML